MKEKMQNLIEKFKKFCKWVWSECKDWHTVVLFIIVVVVMYTPVWGGYLIHLILKKSWGSVMATAYLAFWAGPFTPYFPLCIAITLGIKKLIEKIKSKRKKTSD
ncbi:hypothetical protein [Eubacterium sp.]|uniref:hypothetical protein n=1 Tax=Eubacterium sp. TaxID=142586 RepID=UPI0025C1280A|nr:hypothetical protein [Eubacterium sp.]